MAKFKIDLNPYDTLVYPVALYKWVPGFWFGKWRHYQSHKSTAAALQHYQIIKDCDKGLPIFLPADSTTR